MKPAKLRAYVGSFMAVSGPNCYPEKRDSAIKGMKNDTLQIRYNQTLKREKELKALGFQYVCIWGCQFQAQKTSDNDLKLFMESFDDLNLSERLNPRDSFFGGRTNACKLHCKVDGTSEKIRYVDFTSLYPFINKYARYPKGHPTIITDNFAPLDTYFGIVKVKILTPKGLYHPVLPYRSQGKLKFPLCRTCADAENKQPCTCSDAERAITGTYCTPEVMKAIEKGYKVLHIYEVYHWDESMTYDKCQKTGGLFSEYVNMFLKFKQESSGWPEHCVNDEAKQMEYLADYFEQEGVKLDPSKIVKNPGLRAVSKLALNSLWGKFSQRLEMRKTQYFTAAQADKFFQLVFNPTIDVTNFRIVSPDCIQVEYSEGKDFINDNLNSNIFIGTFTTAWARLRLYDILDLVGENAIYYDTDSLVYLEKSDGPQLLLGDYLGDLTDELGNGDYIIEFISAGPKNYGYLTFKGVEVCKVRGFTLNKVTSKLINLNTIRDVVMDTSGSISKTVRNPNKISRDKTGMKIFSRPENKTYRMVYTKRVILKNMDTVPYGY